jgi:hypothetical protein
MQGLAKDGPYEEALEVWIMRKKNTVQSIRAGQIVLRVTSRPG